MDGGLRALSSSSNSAISVPGTDAHTQEATGGYVPH